MKPPLPREIVGALAVVLALTSCSGDDDDNDTAEPATSETEDTTSETTAATEVERPEGPAADLSEELTGGDGVFVGSAIMGQIPEGYVEAEYAAVGTASSYSSAQELTSDGQWTFEPSGEADYRTRIVVRRPENSADFSGVVLVEWLNVSGGVDADPDYVTTYEEIVRQGHIWVGVSTQAIGIEGGEVAVRVEGPGTEVAGLGLKGIDPERYRSLSHPGDAYSFDIFTQVARALRAGSAPLGDADPTHIIAIGESQSAFAMVTYINGVQPLTQAFDGFFVHSRGGSSFPVIEAGQAADIAGSISGGPRIIRTDMDVPVFVFQTEGDVTSVLGSYGARQDDSDTLRLWEVAGTAHADTRLVGENAQYMDCGVQINDGPQHVVAKAALHHLVAWVTEGTAPPSAPLLEVSEAEGAPAIVRDADGIALGGVRTPPVDVPVRVVSAVQGPVDSVICLLLGSTVPLPPERIAELYASLAEYEAAYAEAVDAAIEGGFILEEDRAAIEEYLHSDLVSE